MTDDAARAEPALREAVARALFDNAHLPWEAEWGEEPPGENPTGVAYEQADVALAAARQVEIEVTCTTCGGLGKRMIGNRPPYPACHRPDCSSGTRTVRAWDVLTGEGK